jgi:hypothetical protein
MIGEEEWRDFYARRYLLPLLKHTTWRKRRNYV